MEGSTGGWFVLDSRGPGREVQKGKPGQALALAQEQVVAVMESSVGGCSFGRTRGQGKRVQDCTLGQAGSGGCTAGWLYINTCRTLSSSCSTDDDGARLGQTIARQTCLHTASMSTVCARGGAAT
jgi:hypothetical protein